MPTPSLALVTCSLQPTLYAEEGELPSLIRAHGVAVDVVSWDDATVDWARFSAVVVRSTWDYFERYDEFCRWLDQVQAVARVFNPPELMRWNSDKRYLRELAARGVRIVPTVFCEPGEPANLASIVSAHEWSRVVIKPAVSGNAYRTHLLDVSDSAERERGQRLVDDILQSTAVLVQPFFPEIKSEGEYSFFFFEGVLSHAIIKRPVPDDYRVQFGYGGTAVAVDAVPLYEQARAVLDQLPEPPTYARIDGVRRGADFFLMEAELIEPYLFLSTAPRAVTEAYVDLVVRLAKSSG